MISAKGLLLSILFLVIVVDASSFIFTVRFKPFTNGNDAPTFPEQAATLQQAAQKWLDGANNGTVELQFNETTANEDCVVSEQKCWHTMTFWFTGSRATQWQNEMLGKSPEEVLTNLNVDAYSANSTTVPPRGQEEEPTLTKFLLAVIFGYFGTSALLFIIFLLIRYQLLKDN